MEKQRDELTKPILTTLSVIEANEQDGLREEKTILGMPTSLFCLSYFGFVVGYSWGVVLPSLQFFVTSKIGGLDLSNFIYSLAIGVTGIGEVFGSLVIGKLCDKHPIRKLILYLLPVSAFGSFLQATAAEPIALMIGRILLGIFSGAFSVFIRTYGARVTTHLNRTRVFNSLTGISGFAYAAGPGFGALMAYAGTSSTSTSYATSPNSSFPLHFALDAYRLPAWSITLLLLFGMIIVGYFFVEKKMLPASTPRQATPRTPFWNPNKAPSLVVLYAMSVFFAVTSTVSTLESLSTPIMADLFARDIQGSSLLYILGGGISLLAVLCLYLAAGKYSDRRLLLVVLGSIAVAALLMTDFDRKAGDACSVYSFTTRHDCIDSFPSRICAWNQDVCLQCAPICRDPKHILPVAQYFVGFSLAMLACTAGRTVASSMFSKLLGSAPQGSMSGLLIASAAIAKLAAPMAGIRLLFIYGQGAPSTLAPMAVLGGSASLLLILASIYYKKLDPNMYYS